jgi:hypothetical protein
MFCILPGEGKNKKVYRIQKCVPGCMLIFLKTKAGLKTFRSDQLFIQGFPSGKMVV